MKIIFLNTWKGRMKKNIIDFIEEQKYDTDVFCFQEVENEMQSIIKDILPDHKENLAIKQKEKGQIINGTYVRGYEVPNFETLLLGDNETGLAIYTEIRTTDGALHVVNVHGVAHPGHKMDTPGRLRQSEVILSFLESKNGKKIVGGDFNLMHPAESLSQFKRAGYRDLITEFSIPTTRNHLAWNQHLVKQYHADFVFINESVVLAEFAVVENEVSDHLPLVLTLAS